ncbi:MAG: glucose-6-phosphate isomerase, partial [Alphaproteobacteria bacterium]
MPFSVDLSRAQALAQSIAFADAIGAMPDALARLKSDYDSNTLPLLRVPQDQEAIDTARNFADRVKQGASHIVLLGTGGSALGAKVLQAIASEGDGPRLIVLDNLDGLTQARITQSLPLATTHVIAISKSGTTAETMAQCLALLGAYEAADVPDKGRFFAITEPGDRPLRALATKRGWPLLDHHTGVGGRFAVMTNVGTVPGFLLGLNMADFLAGAQAALDPALAGNIDCDA